MIRKLAVLGAGSWGTALALHAAKVCPCVSLWGHRHEHIARMNEARENEQYLPGIAFPCNVYPEVNLADALLDADAILISVPSKAFSQTISSIKALLPSPIPILYATKGLEHGTGKFLHSVLDEYFDDYMSEYAILSGPSFAKEVAIGLPTAVTIAASQISLADFFAPLFHHHNFRIYTSTDLVGVEIGGAYKNVIAISAGVSDGLGFGANARAALITRGLAEMQRLGAAVGGRIETFMGLAGLGDLLLTATDDQSRNRRFGLALGQGISANIAEQAIGQVVEGAATSIEILRLAQSHGLDLPIAKQVHDVIYEGLSAKDAVLNLLNRAAKREEI